MTKDQVHHVILHERRQLAKAVGAVLKGNLRFKERAHHRREVVGERGIKQFPVVNFSCSAASAGVVCAAKGGGETRRPLFPRP